MPKRVIGFEPMCTSDKLGACAEWAQAEYAWLYGLADCNGSFELTNLRVIGGRVAAICKDLSLARLEQIFSESHDKGLLFIWELNGKKYGYWTGSDVPGRLPPSSWRNRLERLAPPVPREQLAEYVQRFTRRGRTPVSPAITEELTRSATEAAPQALSDACPHVLNPPLEPTPAQDWERDEKGNQEERESAEVPSVISPKTLLEIYEQARGSLPPVRVLTAERSSRGLARLLAKPGDRADFVETFRAAVRRASRTPFLCGVSPSGWKASIDWLIANGTNCLKVLEGHYDGHRAAQANRAGTSASDADGNPGTRRDQEARDR